MTIKQMRITLGMTQEQFANYFHINICTLRMWEQGVNRTPDYVLFSIQRVLELEGKLLNTEESKDDLHM